MRSLAGFAMRGPSQAALVAAGAAVLSLLLPLVAAVSSAVVALVTLRQGPREGLTVIGIAGLGSAVLVWLALGTPWPALGFLGILWVPLGFLALVLRGTRSLAMTVLAAALLGLLILVGIHLATDDPARYWVALMEPARAALVEGELVDEARSQALIQALATWMTGAFAASLYAQFLLALFLARWWQAVLYNPEGFGAEFRALRLPKALGYAALALLGLRIWQPESTWGYELLVLLVPLLLIQGLAVAHGVRHALGASVGWLVGVYALLVLLMPYAEMLLLGLGLTDLWLDIRGRMAATRS
jgi:hypothetical protein